MRQERRQHDERHAQAIDAEEVLQVERAEVDPVLPFHELEAAARPCRNAKNIQIESARIATESGKSDPLRRWACPASGKQQDEHRRDRGEEDEDGEFHVLPSLTAGCAANTATTKMMTPAAKPRP